ncbi:hypothetical protein [Schumannella luteola]
MTARSSFLAATGLLVSLTIAGCATTPASSGSGSKPGGATDPAPNGTATASCESPGIPDDLKPFSSALVTEPIPEGAAYGDGSEIAFTTSLGAGLNPTYELLQFVDGVPTSNTGGIWDDAGDGRYTNNLLVFDSELDGQAGLIEVTAIPDGVAFDGERYDGDTLVLGIYCITYAVE